MTNKTKQSLGNKNGPAYIRSAVRGWYCTPSRSLYLSDDGAIVRRINPSCKTGCLRKYQVRHPNLKIENRLIIAGAKLSGERLDHHVCAKAKSILSGAEPVDCVTAPPMQMCIDCGNMATLIMPCNCGHTMEDKNGRLLVNVSDYSVQKNRIRVTLDMPGYPKTVLAFPTELIPKTDLLTIRESDKPKIAIRVPAESLKLQLLMRKKND